MDLHVGNFLELPLHGVECIVERNGMIGLRLVQLLDVLGENRVPRHVDLNSDAHGNFYAVCASMGNFHDDPTPRNAPVQALQRIDALPDKRLQSRGAFGTFERDLEWLVQGHPPNFGRALPPCRYYLNRQPSARFPRSHYRIRAEPVTI